jgi:integrase
VLLKATRRDLLGLRDRALLLTAYHTGCRRSELVAMAVTDIDGPDGDGTGVVAIGRSKTDQEGQGTRHICRRRRCRRSKSGAKAGISRGALFRRVETWLRIGAIGGGVGAASGLDHADL